MARSITLKLNDRTEAAIEDLIARSGLGSDAAVMREALAVYRQIQDMRDQGLQIVIHSADGTGGPGYLKVSRAQDGAASDPRPALRLIPGGLAG